MGCDHDKSAYSAGAVTDTLAISYLQWKSWGQAAMPTTEDGKRLKAVAKRLHARHILLASWKKGSAVRFFTYRPRASEKAKEWTEVTDLNAVFR